MQMNRIKMYCSSSHVPRDEPAERISHPFILLALKKVKLGRDAASKIFSYLVQAIILQYLYLTTVTVQVAVL